MKFKSPTSVHFIKDLTPEQEYILISESLSKPKERINTGNGKSLILSDAKLLEKNEIAYIDLLYNKKNQNSFVIFMMLISAHPFRNFLREIENIERFPILHNLKKIYSKISNKETIDIEKFLNFDDCFDIKESYSFILKNIHQELCKYYYFEENTWSSQKKGKALKHIFNEYSPIVEIFQGKILEDFCGMKSGFFDFININNNPQSILTNKKGTKLPFIILVKVSQFISIDNYIASSIIIEENNSFSILVNCNNTWFKYHTDGFEMVNESAFLNNIKFIVFSKVK